jgi:hypothetical protein
MRRPISKRSCATRSCSSGYVVPHLPLDALTAVAALLVAYVGRSPPRASCMARASMIDRRTTLAVRRRLLWQTRGLLPQGQHGCASLSLTHSSTRPRILTVCACIVVCCGCACSGAFGNEGAPGGVRDNAGGQGHARHLWQKVPAPLQGHRTGTPTPTCPLLYSSSPTPPHHRLLTTAIPASTLGCHTAGGGGCRWPSWYA